MMNDRYLAAYMMGVQPVLVLALTSTPGTWSRVDTCRLMLQAKWSGVRPDWSLWFTCRLELLERSLLMVSLSSCLRAEMSCR